MPVQKVCLVCNTSFKVKHSRAKTAKYCSRKCADIGRNTQVKIICEQCGKKFMIFQCFAKTRRFCSIKCRTPPTYQICEICGKKFRIRPNRTKTSHYCSAECYTISGRQGAPPGPKIPRIQIQCLNCKHDISLLPKKAIGRMFCSRSCFYEYQGPTSIERLLMHELDNLEFDYECEYHIGQWYIDFAFPSIKLAIEADGVYWHSLPHIQDKDKRKNKWLENHGWTVIHFTGDEIRMSSHDCVIQIAKHIVVNWHLNLPAVPILQK